MCGYVGSSNLGARVGREGIPSVLAELAMTLRRQECGTDLHANAIRSFRLS